MKNEYKLNIKKYSTHSMICSLIGKNKKVLDIGCNDGYIGKSSDSTNIFYGVEYSSASVEKAKEFYVDAVQGDLNMLPKLSFEKNFDVILFADVLEHLMYPEKVLTEYVKYGKSESEIIVSLPNVANWQVRLNLLFGNFNYTKTGILDETHLHLYTVESAKKLVESCGLQVKKVYGGASFFGPTIKAFPFLAGLLSTSIVIVCKK